MLGKSIRKLTKKTLMLIVGSTVTITIAATSLEAQEKIIVATEGAFAPWTFTDAQGNLQGFELDLARSVCERLSLTCEFVAQEFTAMIPGLLAGKFDVIISAMSITEERKKVIEFTMPYARTANGFVAAKGSEFIELPGGGQRFDLDKQEDAAQKAIQEMKPILTGKVLGVQKGSISASFVDKYLRTDMQVREYGSVQDQDLDLASGRVDIAIGSMVAFHKSLTTGMLNEFETVGPTFVGGVFGLGYAAGLRKEDAALRERINTALQAAIDDGTIKKLSDKWLGIDVTP